MHRRLAGLRRTLVILGLVAGWAGVSDARPQDDGKTKKTPTSPLSLEAILIEPSTPAIDTLCQLRVQVKNSAKKTISALDFGVSIGGQPLKVYEQQLFLESLEPGTMAEVHLYNFWTTETGRGAPKNGKLQLEVTLREAQWVEVTTEEDGTEVWTLGDKVPGLPVVKKLVIPMKKVGAPRKQ